MINLRLVPAIALRTFEQFSATGLLDPRPPVPSHGFGTAAPGCVSFPESWTPDVIARRTDDMLAGTPQPLWYSIYDRRIAFRRYDGLWLMILTHSPEPIRGFDRAAQVIAVFPHDSGPAITPPRHSVAGLYERIFTQALEAFDDLHNSRATEFSGVAVWLRHSGLIAEALVWLLLCQKHFPAHFGEDTWAALHAMAVAGIFDDCQGFDALTHIETQWALQYPATWGLASRARRHSQPIIVEHSRLPGSDEITRVCRQWMEGALPSHVRAHPETRVTAGPRTTSKLTVVLTLPRGRAALEVLGDLEGRHNGLTVTAIEHAAHPGDRLAGLILALALSELLGGDRGYVTFPESFVAEVDRPRLLRAETSTSDLARLVLLDVDARGRTHTDDLAGD